MIIIDLDNKILRFAGRNDVDGYNLEISSYPDQQPYLKLPNLPTYFENDGVIVYCSLNHPTKLFQLLQVSNALDHLRFQKTILCIPYLMGARSDRVLQRGDSFDLEIVAGLINSCGFKKVYLYDVHSDVSLALVKNAVPHTNKALVSSYSKESSILICPDAGAAKKVNKYPQWNQSFQDIVYCVEQRDPVGNVLIKVLEPEKCFDKNCVIIDDICDGGRTFIEIAKQIRPKHLTLIVTHGIFSKGFEELEKYFHEIIVSDSYQSHYESNIVTMIHHGI